MTIQPMPARDDTAERTDSRALRVDEVQAQWLQNIGAGVGAASIFALLAWGVGADLTQAWRWPLVTGGVVFGLGQVLRAFVDEFRAERRWRKRETEHAIEMAIIVDELEIVEEECNSLRTHNDALSAEVSRLQSRNASLNYEWRKAKAGPRTILREDMVNATTRRNVLHIVRVWAETGKRPARRDMVPSEMTRNEWDDAYAELRPVLALPGTPTEAEMMHALNVQWGSPFPDDDGQPTEPTSSVGRAARPSRPEME